MEDHEYDETEWEDMSKKELINEIHSLHTELQQRTDEIQELNQNNLKLTRKIKQFQSGTQRNDDTDDDNENLSQGMNDVLITAALETENDELREKLSKLQNDYNAIKEKNLEYLSHIKVYQEEKTETDSEIRNLRKKIDDLERTISENEESLRVNMRKSQDITKQKKDTQKQQLQLYEENENLQKEVSVLSITLLSLSLSLSL